MRPPPILRFLTATLVTILWRVLVGLSVGMSAIRGIAFDAGVPTSALQLLQFGAIALATVVMILGPRIESLPKQAAWLALGLGLFVVVSFVGSAFSVAPSMSLADSALTLVMFGFLAVTAFWRWRGSWATACADLRFLALVLGLFLAAGFALAAAGFPGSVGEYGRLTGLYSNANYAGVIGAVTAILALSLLGNLPRGLTGALVASAIVGVSTVLLSGSRTAILAATVGLTIMVVLRLRQPWRKVLAATVGLAICAAAVLVPVALFRGDSSLPSDFDPGETRGQPATEPTESPGSSTSPPPDDSPANSGESPEPGPTPDEPVTAPPPDDVDAEAEENSIPVSNGSSEASGSADTINDQTSGRLELVLRSLAVFVDSPLLGTGLGTASIVLDGVETHNLALQILLETGLLGAFAMLIVLGLLVLVLVSSRPPPVLTGAVVAIGVVETALSSMLGWGGPTALSFWLVVVAFCSTSPIAQRSIRGSKPTS